MSGGRRGDARRARRSGCRRSASPCAGSWSADALRAGRLRDAGERRAQVALDVDRQRLERRDVQHAAAPLLLRLGRNISRSIAARNAASVLPEPVGASSSVDSPGERSAASRASAAGVGSAKEPRNHSRTAGWKPERAARLTAAFSRTTRGDRFPCSSGRRRSAAHADRAPRPGSRCRRAPCPAAAGRSLESAGRSRTCAGRSPGSSRTRSRRRCAAPPRAPVRSERS